jgi:hypothetical protein
MLVMADVGASTKDFALHQAVLDQDIQLVRKLLSRGAAIDVIGSRKYGYGSALHLAVREGHLDIAKLLLDRGAQVDVLDPDDFTPLHNAAWNGNLEMTELLLAAGADIEASTYDGDTPLTLAQNNDQPQVAGFIQAKLQTQSGVDTTVVSTTAGDTGITDISGTYTSKITGDNQRLAFQSVKYPEVKLVQNGNEITGSIDEGLGGLIWGRFEGDTIFYNWQEGGSPSGSGKWVVKPGSNEIVGYWSHTWRGAGKWNLTKIAPDISGTYIAETTGSAIVQASQPVKTVKKLNGKLIVLKQTGNTITGSVGSQSNWIKGTREGNIINFYIIASSEIAGSWEINADATHLEGKWHTDDGWAPSGKWNLTKIDDDD